ncbi:sugar phosphate isomerase/epimerase family protein [Aspergillus fijiensis CBS 313.89]|uniref:Sugar phosphate isomerase n=1 Tax=Aspergillus fijiensis CBS 313.89 TaxID=1448319 RepID=A0A8G1RKF2_9EURO|nr:sugar phosphate isomerase [Aspergillus fijiensis CBS 313.89]RAK74323.1 sugar phosphate isomerase [Aspergillus fijiensis CBS 313.89]
MSEMIWYNHSPALNSGKPFSRDLSYKHPLNHRLPLNHTHDPFTHRNNTTMTKSKLTPPNPLGIATLSLGSAAHHTLEARLHAAAAAGYTHIDLFDDDWAHYLSAHHSRALPRPQTPWTSTAETLRIAAQLGSLAASLSLKIACTQPCREIEGILDPTARRAALDSVAARFPFMRAFGTDLVFLCANIRTDEGVTSDLEVVAKDLAELGDMARAYAEADGGPMLRIGYEGLSWARRNTWASSWEAVQAADRANVGLVVDAFNVLAVEWADPYAADGSGRVHGNLEVARRGLRESMRSLVRRVPAEKIFFFQVGDAVRVGLEEVRAWDVQGDTPRLLPWSRGYRLFPGEKERGAYMPVEVVAAAVLETGYEGPVSLEVFNHSLGEKDASVPRVHAERGMKGLRWLLEEVANVPALGDATQ